VCVTPIEAHSPVKLLNRTKNRTPSHMLNNNSLWVFVLCAVCVTIYSIDSKFWLVSDLAELHALTPTTRSSCALLVHAMNSAITIT